MRASALSYIKVLGMILNHCKSYRGFMLFLFASRLDNETMTLSFTLVSSLVLSKVAK